jgi:hypothetical protein
VRFVGLVAAVGILGSLGAACGSRTSMLDPDAYDSNGQGVVGAAGRANVPGNGTAGKSSNGTGLLGRAGSGSTTPVGGPVNGVDTSLAVTPCQQYCPGYSTQCKQRLEGQDCLSTCQGELNGFGPSCQTLGIAALNCLTPFFSARGGDCNSAVNHALAKCGTIVASFDSCKKHFDGSTPPARSREAFAGCERAGGGDSTGCNESFSCGNDNYVTFCSLPTGSMLFECGCLNATGQMASGRLPPSGNICLDATVLCQ